MRFFDGKNCPCPSDCDRHGKCKECIAFHKARNEQNYCEYLKQRQQGTPERALPDGRTIRLLDYAPCAG